jgi:hypothetical protein
MGICVSTEVVYFNSALCAVLVSGRDVSSQYNVLRGPC